MWVGGGPDLPWFDPESRRHRRMGANALSQARMRTVDRLRYHLNKRPSGTNPHNNVCKGLSLQQMLTWLRKAKVVDDRHVTRQDVAACFNAHRQPLLTLEALPAFLRSLSQRRHLDSSRLVARLLDESSSMPARVATAAGLQMEATKSAPVTNKNTPLSAPASGVPTQGVPTRSNPQGLARSWRWPPPRWPPPARWPTSRRGGRPRTTSNTPSKERVGGGGSRSSSVASQRSTCGVTMVPAPTFRRSRSRTPMARCIRQGSRSTLTMSSSTRGSEEPLGRVVWSDWSAASSNSRRTRSRSGLRITSPRPSMQRGCLRTTPVSDTKLMRSNSCAAAVAAVAAGSRGTVPAAQATPALSAAAAIAAATAAGTRPNSGRTPIQKPGQGQAKTQAQGKDKSSVKKTSEISTKRSVKSLSRSVDYKISSEAGTQTDLPLQEDRGKNSQLKLKSTSSSTDKFFNMIDSGTQTLFAKDGLPRKYQIKKQHYGSGTSWHPPSPLEEENIQIAYPITCTRIDVSSKMSFYSPERSPSSLSPQQGSYQSLAVTSPNNSLPAVTDKSPEHDLPLNPEWIADEASKSKTSRRKTGGSGRKSSPKRQRSGKRSRGRRRRPQGTSQQNGRRKRAISKSKSPSGSIGGSPQRLANRCPLRSYSAILTKNKSSVIQVKKAAGDNFFDSSSAKNPTTDSDSPGEDASKKPSVGKTDNVIRGTKDISKSNSDKNVSLKPRQCASTSPRRSPTPSRKSSPILSTRPHNPEKPLSPTHSLITSTSPTKSLLGNINRATSISPTRNSNRKEVKRKTSPQRKRSGKGYKLKRRETQNLSSPGEKVLSGSQTSVKVPEHEVPLPEQSKSSTKTNTDVSQKTGNDSSDISSIPLVVKTPRRVDDNDSSSKEGIQGSLPMFDIEKIVSTTAVGQEANASWHKTKEKSSQSTILMKVVLDIEDAIISTGQSDVGGQTQTDLSICPKVSFCAEAKSQEQNLVPPESSDVKKTAKATVEAKLITPKKSRSITPTWKERSSKSPALLHKTKSPPRLNTQRSTTPVPSRSAPPKLRTGGMRTVSMSPGRANSRSPPPRNDSRSPFRRISQSPPRSSVSFTSSGGGGGGRFNSRSPQGSVVAGRSRSPNAQRRSASPRLMRSSGSNARSTSRRMSRSPNASARSPPRGPSGYARHSSSRGAKRLLDVRKSAALTSAAAAALRRGRGKYGRSPGRSPNRSSISARSPPTARSPTARGRLNASPTSVTLHATSSKRSGAPKTHKSRTKIASARTERLKPRTSSGLRRNGPAQSAKASGGAAASSSSYVKYTPKPSAPASGSPSRLVMLDQKKSRRTRSPQRGRSGRQTPVSTSNNNSGGGRRQKPNPSSHK